jgi:hypothetical protein
MSRDTTGPIPFLSTEAHPESAPACVNSNEAANREPPVADFLAPVEYAWTEAGFEARQALRSYCEETRADY